MQPLPAQTPSPAKPGKPPALEAAAGYTPQQLYALLLETGRMSGDFGRDTAWELAREVIARLWQEYADEPAPAEVLEDWIEDVLLAKPYPRAARRFIIARDRRDRAPGDLAETEVARVNDYLEKLDWQVRENSNMTYSLQGLNNYLSSALSQSYWLNQIYPGPIREAHESGDFHIHDLNQLSVYCVGWDLSDLLREGFRGVSGKVETHPPKHFRTALGQIVNFFYTLQGEAAGAQAFSSFDTLLAPYIRYDNLDYKAVKQALQEFVFNINVPTRVGFQTPFTNITLDLVCPSHYREQPVCIGGQFMTDTYGEFREEMACFNKALFEVMTEGDARGRIMTFPIPTINLTKDFDWDDPNLDGLWEMTGKYGVPYFSNFINSDMDPEDARSMCCRLRIDNTQLEMRGGALFGAHPLTGSIGVVTLNLPRIGHLARDVEDFKARLAGLMDLASESMEIKRAVLEKLTDANLYPYTTFYLRGVKERYGVYWKNHFSTIGLVGMNEAALNLIGEDITTAEGHAFAEDILDFMRVRLVRYQKATGHNYNLEATPAEGTSYRLARKDRQRFPGITAANDHAGERAPVPFYTNSTHLPVGHTDDPFAALDHQDALQTKYTGGTVLHLFLGERIREPRTVKKLVRKIAEGYKLPYFSFTPTFSICPDHGYLSGEHFHCPHCGKESEVYSRVVGYLRPVHQWNDGKQAEFAERRTLRFRDEHTRGSEPAEALWTEQ